MLRTGMGDLMRRYDSGLALSPFTIAAQRAGLHIQLRHDHVP
jgi:hypothetical protein